VTAYQRRVENYGPGGLIDAQDIQFELTGEVEQAYLSPSRLKNAYATLRQWSVDAQDAYDTWPTKTNAQKDATHRETIRRLGILMDRLADLLLLEGRS
jgi:hypothetical protein